ncbi:oxygenase MpaB family protein [Streptomyces sp. NPDC006422]|uniref:oxygenase MpaB family protein n=1 Tax=unclassified Streptomyces TaxID=2593676 RepID=UPI0033BEA307
MTTAPSRTRAFGRDWPHGRSTRSSVVAQFGTSRADLAAWALTTGDPLADAVVEEIHHGGRVVRAAFQKGLADGLASVEDPPDAVAALLAQTEATPHYVDDELLDQASLPHFNSPLPVSIISLAAGALIRTYESPSIAQVLTMTGRLIDGVPRRLEETGRWVNTVMVPGSLRPGQPGYVATLQVRLMHAYMRRLARNRGYDEAALGVPINQIDLARTWMDFTLVSYRAKHAMGYELTSAETASLYRYWWYIAHLLGVDAELVEGISSNEDAARVDSLLQAVTGPRIPEASPLAHATLKAIAQTLSAVTPLPERVGQQALYALTRRFHGPGLARELNLPRAAVADAVLAAGIRGLRARQTRQRRDPAAWRAAQQANVAAAREITERPGDQVAYEEAARHGAATD